MPVSGTGAFEMQSHAADAASQVQSRALLVTRGDYEGTEYDLTPGPQNDGVNVSRMLQNAYGGQNISITTEEKTKTKSELKKAIQTAFADSDADDVNYFLLFRARTAGWTLSGNGKKP